MIVVNNYKKPNSYIIRKTVEEYPYTNIDAKITQITYFYGINRFKNAIFSLNENDLVMIDAEYNWEIEDLTRVEPPTSNDKIIYFYDYDKAKQIFMKICKAKLIWAEHSDEELFLESPLLSCIMEQMGDSERIVTTFEILESTQKPNVYVV